MQGILGILFKSLLEVISDVIVKLLSRPDIVKDEVVPELSNLDFRGTEERTADLLDRFESSVSSGMLGTHENGSLVR